MDIESFAIGMKYGAKSGGGGGSGGGVLVVHADADTGALDKTWQEIHDASLVGVVVILEIEDSYIACHFVEAVSSGGGSYDIGYDMNTSPVRYRATSANGYPAYTEE